MRAARRAILLLSAGTVLACLAPASTHAEEGKAKPLPTWKKGVEEGTVEIDGQVEKFVAWVPAGYSPKKPAPAVLLLHGNGGTAQSFLQVVKNLAGKDGPLLIALERCDNQQKAEGYTAKYLEGLKKQFALQEGMLFVLGFSGGGFRVWDDVVAKAEEVGKFRGVVIVGSGRQNFDPADKPSTPSTVILVGDPKDSNFTETGPAAEKQLTEKGYEVIVLEHSAGHSMAQPELKDVFAWIETVIAGKKPTLVTQRVGEDPKKKRKN